MLRRIITKFRKLVAFPLRLYWKKEIPTVILAPGRVRSMALHHSLNQAGIFSLKVEFARASNLGSVNFARRHILFGKQKAKIISLVRDPTAVLITYFFSKAQKDRIPEAKVALENRDVKQLQTIFIEKVLRTPRASSHLQWFDLNFYPLTNMDIFEHEFDRGQGYTVIQDSRYPTLILRAELDDHIKSSLIQEFLNVAPIQIKRSNSARQKEYADVYSKFKSSLVIPSDVISLIYDSRFVKHFFSLKEIEQLKEKWGSGLKPNK